jgi:hypothetical protein
MFVCDKINSAIVTGMDQIEDFADGRQKAWCVHCGGWIRDLEASRDQVPPKTLRRKL